MLFCVFQGIVLQPLLIKRIHLHQNQRTNHKEETTLNTKIKCLSLLLALVLVLGMLPAAAMGEGNEPVTVKATYTQEGTSIFLPGTCEVQYTINDTAESDITIDVMDAVMKALPDGESMPTHQLKVKVSITNNSPNAFKYKNNGLQVGTNSYENESNLTGFVGYDGHELPLSRISNIATGHPAIKKLLGKNINGNDEGFEVLLKLYDKLKEQNYETLSDYILDYYRDIYTNQTLTWEDLKGSTYRTTLISHFNSARYNAGFIANEKNRQSLSVSPLKDYAYYPDSDTIQIKWPEQELAAISYDIFYQDFFSVVFGDEIPNIHIGKRDHGIGDYVNTTTEPYTEANKYLNSIGQIDSGETASFKMTITLEGGMGNPYGSYVFDDLFNLTLQFVRAPQASTTTPPQASTTTPPKTGDNANVQLWLALACLSLGCMAAAFGKARIQTRRKG